MVRVVAFFVALMFFSASSGFAQSFKAPSAQAQPPAVKIDLSARAAGIDAMAASAALKDTKPAARSMNVPRTPTKRSFFKSPLFYVIVAGVAATVIIVAAKGGYSDNGSGY